jgi:hypothetical protein
MKRQNDEIRMSNDELMSNDKSTKKARERVVFLSFSYFGFLGHSSLVLRHFPSRISQHFFDGGVSSENAAQAVLAQRYHSKFRSLLF